MKSKLPQMKPDRYCSRLEASSVICECQMGHALIHGSSAERKKRRSIKLHGDSVNHRAEVIMCFFLELWRPECGWFRTCEGSGRLHVHFVLLAGEGWTCAGRPSVQVGMNGALTFSAVETKHHQNTSPSPCTMEMVPAVLHLGENKWHKFQLTHAWSSKREYIQNIDKKAYTYCIQISNILFIYLVINVVKAIIWYS